MDEVKPDAVAEPILGLRLTVFPDDTNMQLRTEAEVINGATSQIRELRERVAELEGTEKGMGAALRLAHPYKDRATDAEARVAELEKENAKIMTDVNVQAVRVAQLKDLAEDMYPLIAAEFDGTDEVKSINARFDVLVEEKEVSDGN